LQLTAIARAGVSNGELRAHFRSKDAIVAEVYLERLRAAPMEIDVEHTAQECISAQFELLMMLLAGEPGLAAACSSALVSDEPAVRSVQQRIHAELRTRVRAAMRSGAWPEVTETLEFGLIGSLVHASCGGVTSGQTADRLASVVAAVLPDGDRQAP
jgi:AcrR family transcriptional regulator